MQGGSPDRVERRLAAILAADIAGYSRLMGHDEAGTLARVNALRRRLIDPKITEHKGRIVKTTGDGMLIEFPSVVEAVSSAVGWQREMAAQNADLPEDNRIEFRIGINLGDIIVEDGDIHGDGVNVAARLEALADPGGICVSAIVHDQVQGRLDCAFDDLGEQSLKNIARRIRVYRVSNSSAGSSSFGTPLALPEKPSIAVLPFQNISGDPEQEIFADGMVEDITTALSKIRWFFVIARNSSFTYKGRAVDVKRVGRELGVRYALEGSVRKGGNRLRITVQLVEAGTGNHVWAERYDRDVSDIFELQDEITERVVAAIEPELYAAENLRSRRKPPESLDAWECVIRALSALGRITREAAVEAEQLCRRAIAIAPSYGQAHSLLAWALLRRTIWSGDLQEVLGEVDAAAQTALEIDERDAWAHFVHGNMFNRLRRFDEAEREIRRALELNPSFALGHAFYGAALNGLGRYEETIDSAGRALRLSPNDRAVGNFASLIATVACFGAGRYDECIARARGMIEQYPEDIRGYYALAAALQVHGDSAAAQKAAAELLQRRPEFTLAWMKKNIPLAGDLAERTIKALREAGIPEGCA